MNNANAITNTTKSVVILNHVYFSNNNKNIYILL